MNKYPMILLGICSMIFVLLLTLTSSGQIMSVRPDVIYMTKSVSTELSASLSEAEHYSGQGNYSLALELLSRSLNKVEKSQNQFDKVVSLNSIGSIYSNLENHQKALSFYQEALRVCLVTEPDACKAIIISNIGMSHAKLGSYQEAGKYLEASILIKQQSKDYFGQANTLNKYGFILRLTKNYALAITKHQEALSLVDNEITRTKSPIGLRNARLEISKADILDEIGVDLLELKKNVEALQYFEQALAIYLKFRDVYGEREVKTHLMRFWTVNKNYPLAIIHGKRVVNILQSTRENISNLEDGVKETFLANSENTYRELAQILIDQERFPEAQEVLELLKNDEYKQLMRTSNSSKSIPYSESEKLVTAKVDKLAVLNNELSELKKEQKELGTAFTPNKQKRIEQISADIKIINAEFETTLNSLKTEKSVTSRIEDIKDEQNLQSALLNLSKETNSGVVALYTVIGTEGEKDVGGDAAKDKTRSKFGWVILVTAKDRKAYPIDVKDLEETVFQFRSALSSDKYDPKPLAKKLYAAIFRQTSDKQKVTLEQDLQSILGKYKDKTIMWSLDGVLRYVPMAALHDDAGYLVEKYRNVLFTKKSLLWLMNQSKPGTQTLGLGVSAGNSVLKMSKLPGVEKELSDIIKQTNERTGILNGTRKINSQFKKQEILNLKEEDNNFQNVHIASHYSFNTVEQNESYLLVGDGKLTFREMKTENNLFGTIDLLTLSACDTATIGNGKESEGFGYLAQSLGAKSVIASLWKISDAGTPELMIRFYKLRTENPAMSKGEAFNRAQLSLLSNDNSSGISAAADKRSELAGKNTETLYLPQFVKDSKRPFAHPYFWASFVLIGNWR